MFIDVVSDSLPDMDENGVNFIKSNFYPQKLVTGHLLSAQGHYAPMAEMS